MKINKFNSITIMLFGFFQVVFIYTSFSQNDCPPNGGAEMNNFINWKTFAGTSTPNTQNLNNFNLNFSSDRFNTVGSLNQSLYIPGTANNMLVNKQDFYGEFSVPYEGNTCFVLGNNKDGGQDEAMAYTFIVTEQNKNFKFSYALVLDDGGGHLVGGKNPSFVYYVKQGNNNSIKPSLFDGLYNSTNREIKADLSNPFFSVSKKDQKVVYKDWQCATINLHKYVGKLVTFVAMTRDCTEGGHFAYAYIDGLCSDYYLSTSFSMNSERYCPNHDVIMKDIVSENEDSYTLSVFECQSNGSIINNNNSFSMNFLQTVPETINVKDFFIQTGGKKFECGKYYIVILTVKNQCSTLGANYKIIKFECPTINLQDVNICCGQSTTIGVPFGNDQTYSWSSIPANTNATTNSIIVEPITPTLYNLELTDYVFPFPSKKGCVANGSAVVFPLPPNFLTIEKKFNKCSLVPTYNSKVNLDYTGTICTPATSAFNLARPNYVSNLTSTLQNTVKWYFRYFTDPDNCPNGNSLQASDWMFLGTQSTMNPPYGRGEIKAVYEDPCKSPITQTWTGNVFLGTNLDYLKEDFALISPGRMEPTHPTIPERRIMRISEFHPCAPENVGDAPAYGNISDFQLLIFNRWGTNFRTITKADIDKGPNDAVLQGDIFWDGRIVKNGPLVQKGVYVYQLRVQMCPGSNWVDVTSKIYTAQRKNCVVILPFFPALCFGWLNLSSDAVAITVDY